MLVWQGFVAAVREYLGGPFKQAIAKQKFFNRMMVRMYLDIEAERIDAYLADLSTGGLNSILATKDGNPPSQSKVDFLQKLGISQSGIDVDLLEKRLDKAVEKDERATIADVLDLFSPDMAESDFVKNLRFGFDKGDLKEFFDVLRRYKTA